MKRSRTALWVLIIAVALVVGWLVVSRMPGLDAALPSATASASSTAGSPAAKDDTALIAQLFQQHKGDVEVHASGTVVRVLSDDTEGDRHQRFILRLSTGQTVLVAHNIDVAPRLDGIAVGDTVEFLGEYVWSDQGGTVHWTHHDPDGTHRAGWLKWNGRTYG